MKPVPRYTLGKTERLKSRKLIQQVFAQGKSFQQFPLKVVYLNANQTADLQAGFTVSSRNFKKATDRNRIKRLMKETYRLQKNPLEQKLTSTSSSLAVFFIYIGKEIPVYAELFACMKKAINKLLQFHHEAAQ